MSRTTDHVTTAEQLAALPEDGMRYELVNGVLNMMSPAGGRHGKLSLKLGRRLGDYVEQHHLGDAYGAETGFLIRQDPDTVLAPDFAFASPATVGESGDSPRFLPFVPNLIAEVVSPSDRFAEVEAKASAWIDAGVRIALVVDPDTSTVHEFRSDSEVRVHSGGFIDLSDVLPGFRLDVSELFA